MNEFVLFCLVMLAVVLFMILVVYLIEKTFFPIVIIGVFCIIIGILTSLREKDEEQGGGPK